MLPIWWTYQKVFSNNEGFTEDPHRYGGFDYGSHVGGHFENESCTNFSLVIRNILCTKIGGERPTFNFSQDIRPLAMEAKLPPIWDNKSKKSCS